MKLYFFHIVVILLALGCAQGAPVMTNCYACAAGVEVKGARKMCIPGGAGDHHYDGACCTEDDTSAACTPTAADVKDRNLCSPIFELGHTNFYKFCPMTSPLIAPKSSHCTNSVTSFTAGQTP
jgi:hypothetical protein